MMKRDELKWNELKWNGTLPLEEQQIERQTSEKKHCYRARRRLRRSECLFASISFACQILLTLKIQSTI